MRSYTELMIQEEFDELIPEQAPEVRYLIVGTPRTGSNLLADLLWQSGYGVPMEYFTGPAARALMTRWNIFAPSYAQNVMMRRTRGGVFGAKALHPYEWEHAQQLWPTHIIRMIREDKAAQTESLARAIKTDYYADVGDPEERPLDVVVTPQELTFAENTLQMLDQFWNQSVPEPSIVISYEYLVQDRTTTLKTLLTESLGIELPDDWECPAPRVKKLHHGAVDLAELA